MADTPYTTLAREAWNEAAPIHWRQSEALLDAFRRPETSFLTPLHLDELKRIGLEGATVAQLNCNNGRETISMCRAGAAAVTGFDISGAFIDQARRLAEAAGSDARFVVADIYEIGAEFDGAFDIVTVTAGALCFMPDLPGYFRVARRLLKAGGRLNVYDCHPITDMFELDRDRGDRPLGFVRSYFDRTPQKHVTGLDYVGGTTYDARAIYYFHHTLGDITGACLEAGFTIRRLEETGEDPSQAFPSLERAAIKPPLSFLLTAERA
jgi:SAM-dependent methyltransferase